MDKKNQGMDRIERVLANDEVMLKALGEGVKAALKQNKLAGNPVACWRDGKVVELQPEEIPDLD